MINQDYPDLSSPEDENAVPEEKKVSEDKEDGPEELKPKTSEVFFTDGGHNFSSAPDLDGHEGLDTLSLADSVEEFDSAEIKKAWDKATGSQENADSPNSERIQTESENPISKTVEEGSKQNFEVAIGGPNWASGQKDDEDKIVDTTGDIVTLGEATTSDDQTQPESTEPIDEEKSKPKFQVAIGGPWWASGQKDDNDGDNDVDKNDDSGGDKNVPAVTANDREDGELSENDELSEDDELSDDELFNGGDPYSPAPPPMSPTYCMETPASPDVAPNQPLSPIDCVSPPMRTSTDEDEPHESDEEKPPKLSENSPKTLPEETSKVTPLEDKLFLTSSNDSIPVQTSPKGTSVTEALFQKDLEVIPSTSVASEPALIIKSEKETSGKSISIKHDPDKVTEDSNPEISAYDLSIQGTVRSFLAHFLAERSFFDHFGPVPFCRVGGLATGKEPNPKNVLI